MLRLSRRLLLPLRGGRPFTGTKEDASTMEHIETSVKMFRMIRVFRSGGHFAANLDPLTTYLNECDTTRYKKRKLAWLSNYGEEEPTIVQFMNNGQGMDFSVFELHDTPKDKPYYLGDLAFSKYRSFVTVSELVGLLMQCYCGSVGVEIMHIKDNNRRKWLFEQVESTYGPRNWNLSSAYDQRQSFKRLLRADHTAKFLGKNFASSKIFGIDGCEALLPALWTIAEEGASLGVQAMEIGMSHRGRLNTLHNFMCKPLSSICNQFSENEYHSGDIKFHLGARAQIDIDPRENECRGSTMHLSLCANPSHLEAVYPVVIGKTKAKQIYINDTEKRKVVPLILHGDAAFIGQGIVPETMQLSSLPDYAVGGAIHLVINNQIGFTTDATIGRSSSHCTSAAYMIDAPVFHVNGDDIDAVVAVCRLAVQYRQRFRSDVVVDIVCYRRNGHNSLDDPRVTQPLMYQMIEKHPPALDLYSKKLIDAKVMTQKEIDLLSAEVMESNIQEFKQSKEYVPDKYEWLSSNWQGHAISDMKSRPYNQTGCRMSVLLKVGKSLCTYPPDFEIHSNIAKLIQYREKVLKSGKGVNMAFAEALAFGTLLNKYTADSALGLRGISEEERTLLDLDEKPRIGVTYLPHPHVHVRLSGQDVVRGTFNQRHSTIFCQKTERSFVQLNSCFEEEENSRDGATLQVVNSSLSEAAVLAFEYGYSLGNDLALTLWEAQFGDFANVAQSIIDNLIACGESKWNNWSSLVLLLPHGYDGQGPEHSSARIERFLQLIDEEEDKIPGDLEYSKDEILATFDKLVEGRGSDVTFDKNGQPVISRTKLVDALLSFSNGNSAGERYTTMTMTETIAEIDDSDKDDDCITREAWLKIMSSWLQNNAERKHNISVVVPSTPAQYFHVIRRQVHRSMAKPLVVMTSKWLHHHHPCASDLVDLGPATFFRRVIIEGHNGDNMRETTERKIKLKEPAEIKRLIFCSGQIFYRIYHKRNFHDLTDITLVRLEQLGPFPFSMVASTIQKFPNAEIVWAQEEPRNMGAWSYVKPRFDTVLRERKISREPIKYFGRMASAQTATGFCRVHEEEQKLLIDSVLGLHSAGNGNR